MRAPIVSNLTWNLFIPTTRNSQFFLKTNEVVSSQQPVSSELDGSDIDLERSKRAR